MGDCMWMIRAGRGAVLADKFAEGKFIAVGFDIKASPPKGISKEELVERIKANSAETNRHRINSRASQANRFINEMAEGDLVATYNHENREYVFGRIGSDYRYSPDVIEGMSLIREVDWTHHVSRDALSVAARNTLGAIMTLFLINEEVTTEILGKGVPMDQPLPELVPSAPEATESDTEQSPGDLLEEMVGKSSEFIADRIGRLGWEEMQELVAGILRAMGYRTNVSPPGADRGCDVFASPDGLGLQDPRIFVEVKHRKQAMGAQEIRAFLGGRQQGDRCLYVSTGGFTKDAHYEADRSAVPLRLLSLPLVANLVSEYYEELDDETRSIIPLKKLYWPVD